MSVIVVTLVVRMRIWVVEGVMNGVLVEMHRLNIFLVIVVMIELAVRLMIGRGMLISSVAIEAVFVMREPEVMVLMRVALAMMRWHVDRVLMTVVVGLRSLMVLISVVIIIAMSVHAIGLFESRPVILFMSIIAGSVVELLAM